MGVWNWGVDGGEVVCYERIVARLDVPGGVCLVRSLVAWPSEEVYQSDTMLVKD
jgi:hypothetical protein